MKRLVYPLILIMLLAAACQPAAAPPTAAPPTAVPATNTAVPTTATAAAPTTAPTTAAPATATSAPATATTAPTTAPTSQPAATSTQIRVGLTPAQLAAVTALAGQLKISPDQITLVSTEAVNWPDGCLGVQLPGVTCVKGPVAGFRIVLMAGGRTYEYHTNQDGSSVLSTQQGFIPLRVAVRAADDTVQVVDTGFAAQQASQVMGLLPQGGSVGGIAYVLDFKDQPKAQVVDASGTKTLDFVAAPTYGLAVWPGNGSDKPRLAWATSPTGQPPAITQLFIANVDGTEVTPVVTETITSGQPPYELVAERWSADGQSLYFSREPSGIGGYIPFAGASSLYRFNLADKSVSELIPFKPTNGKWVCLDDLSPDASLAVGSCADPKAISVHSVSGGAPDQTITAPGTVTDFRLAGGARFSPDGTRVAFALAKGDPTAEQGYVAVSDGLSGQSTFLTTINNGYYTVVAWLNSNTLLLQLNSLTCNTSCTNSLWTIGTDGTNLSKLTDGTFLTFVGG